MKNFKKLMALVIAGAMLLGAMNFTALADDAPYDSKLVITGLEQGDTVYFYQVLGWEDANGNWDGGWKYQGNFIPLSTTYPVDQATGITVSAEMAGDLARAAQTSDLKAQGTADANGKVTVDAPAAGMYVALIQSNNVDIVYNPVIVSADYNPDNASASWEVAMSAGTYSDEAAAKKSKLEIKKSASTVEGMGDDELAATTAVGDTVTFTVNTTIPGYGTVYEEPQFILKDTLSALKLVTGTVSIAGMSDGTEYDLVENQDGSGYTITFKSNYLTTLKTPKNITVTYDALVTVDAVKNINFETNEVEIDYSHNPADEDDLKAQKDTTQHYTFTIDANNLGDTTSQIGKSGSEIIKVGVDSAGRPITESKTWSLVTEGAHQQSPLAGAHFKLYRNAACTEEYKPKNAAGVEQAPLDIVSDPNGRLLISGLDAGDYWLKETEAPAGYIKAQEAVHFKIEATIEDKDITEYYQYDGNGGITWTSDDKSNDAAWTKYEYSTPILTSYKVLVGDPGEEAAKHTFSNTGVSTGIKWESSDTGTYEAPASIVNKRGVELPSTGGMGTTMFYAIGAILVLGAGILLVSKRRMAAN